MADKTPDLGAAYALETPDDSKRLYAEWAKSYDQGFAVEMDYQMPRRVAEIYGEVAQGAGPVADVGAGTGLVVEHMAGREGLKIDALDISAEMLAVAAKRGIYRGFIQCDLTQRLPIEDGTYGAVISAGTFTHGHVGPDALDEVLRIARSGAVFVLGINAAHFESHGFEAKIAALSPEIRDVDVRSIQIYGPKADAAHRDDKANVAVFFKR
jgi:predicted TPR repeat methyltransferase